MNGTTVLLCDDNEAVHETPLAFLIEHKGDVVSRENILNVVWGYDYFGDIRAVDPLIARIRAKIPEKSSQVTFRTIYGVGYLIDESHA